MCSSKLCIFAGTTEGRELAERFVSQPLEITVCVATEYGEMLLPQAENLHIHRGRLDKEQMTALFRQEQFACVIDATHPYAQIVTENIKAACEDSQTEYLRLLREERSAGAAVVYVSSVEEAADYLRSTEGNILLTTGSKELGAFRELAKRCYARVLPMEESLHSCQAAGIEASHILAMQGPFSKELNLAQIHSGNIRWLVSKDGGRSGGFLEKMDAAAESGVTAVVIGRPKQEEGMDYRSLMLWLKQRFNLTWKPKVTVLGIGPGRVSAMTEEARTAMQQADCLIGAKRMLEYAGPQQSTFEVIRPWDISDRIHEHPEFCRIAVLMSGDTGFFSGCKKLLPLLADCDLTVLPGLSSLSYLCSKVGESYEDVHCISIHGRDHDLIPDVKHFSRIFTLVSGENGMGSLCQRLCAAGLGFVRLCVGEQLSYEDEKVTVGTAEELQFHHFATLSVALIENPKAERCVSYGLPDEAFQRGNRNDGSVIPMTKMEVRAVALSKLQLTEQAVCWDIGAGSGSVAIEMARLTGNMVYAIERNEAALELMKANCRHFAVDNVEIVGGLAPEACASLPAPSHVFIGGSAGNLKEILRCVLEKNPQARIVATAIALESVAELTQCMKDFDFAEAVQLSVSRSRKAGAYHLMTAQNPIHIFTFQKGETE